MSNDTTPGNSEIVSPTLRQLFATGDFKPLADAIKLSHDDRIVFDIIDISDKHQALIKKCNLMGLLTVRIHGTFEKNYGLNNIDHRVDLAIMPDDHIKMTARTIEAITYKEMNRIDSEGW